MSSPTHSGPEFGNVLREWRSRRRVSQLELSLLSATSARHISFLEKGRSNPSREMVQKLAGCLEIPPPEVNSAMVKAGFAPVFPKAELDDESVSILRSAIDTMLKNHLPWPAFACDDQWNLLQSNDSAKSLLQLLGAGDTSNIMHAMLSADDPDGPIINWPEVARLMLQRLNAEQLHHPANESLQAIRTQLLKHPRIHEDENTNELPLNVVVPIKLRDGEKEYSFISMIAQFGAVQEVTYSGVHIELFFPGDQQTESYLRDSI